VQSGDRDGENSRRECEVGGDRSVTGDDPCDAGYVGDICLVVARRRHDRLPGGGGKPAAVTIELGGRPVPEVPGIPPLPADAGQPEPVAELAGGLQRG
jgi:hypothetical protein